MCPKTDLNVRPDWEVSNNASVVLVVAGRRNILSGPISSPPLLGLIALADARALVDRAEAVRDPASCSFAVI